MSQGIIIRNDLVQPDPMQELKTIVSCSCYDDKFAIYHHRAYRESLDEQVEWLTNILKQEHSNNRPEHQNKYQYPS